MEIGRGKRILLIVPPNWGGVMPNLGASQLKANLTRAGHPTEVLYLNYLFTRRIGVPAGEWLTSLTRATMLGEYVFSAALFRQDPASVDDYLNDILAGTDELSYLERAYREPPAAVLTRWRKEAIRLCDGEGLQAILDRDPWFVGFSSNFQQNCASLALLDRIKRARPDIVTAIGGANCEGEMGAELMARFPSIDYVGQGECDHALVALVDALTAGESGRAIPGMLSREAPLSGVPGRPLTSEDLDNLPYPDFDDFFAQRAAQRIDIHVRTNLCMETARGCWWGAKHHCTFCSQNGTSMGFRSKSPQRVLAEIDWLVDRYGPQPMCVADNIMDMKYFRTVLPQLARSRRTTFFYETKANLTREQVRLLAEARVNGIQPGLESLSDKSLRLMRKGVTMMQNVQLLRWCTEYGVEVSWYYLIGFPGESDEELAGIADEIELLHHLEPPDAPGVLRIERFSPYFENPDEYGIAPLEPRKVFRHIYHLPIESIERLVYDFESDAVARKRDGPAFAMVRKMVARWQKAHGHSFLYAIPRWKSLLLIDTRGGARRRFHRLTGLRRAVYESCDRARTLADLARELGEYGGPDSVRGAIESLVRDRLVLASGARYLSLGVEPGRKLTFEDGHVLPSSTTSPWMRPFEAMGQGTGLPRSPREAIRRLEAGLRQFRRSVRNRCTRSAVSAMARLLRQPGSPDDFAVTPAGVDPPR